MRLLVVGGGGREHALCWKLRQSPQLTALFCAPGNPGCAEHAICVPIGAHQVPELVQFCQQERVDFVVVGPEAPLTLGLVDALAAVGIVAFGPTQAAAQLEGSKGFMKDLAQAAGVPTAAYRRFAAADIDAARAFLHQHGAPVVLKADGLAAGKGVMVCLTLAEAEAALSALLVERRFGDAGAEIVIESYLDGEEVSFFALSDGDTVVPLAAAQDHKRAFDGDRGPNTGGMGAYSPAPVFTDALQARVMAEIIAPTVAAMAQRGTPFRGVLFAGLMVTADGPTLIEFNVRFGDPECQVLMVRLESDLLPLLYAAATGTLATATPPTWRSAAAMTVVYAANGYPDAPKTGTAMGHLDAARVVDGVVVFHSGTAQTAAGLVANGGRVLSVTASGDALAVARQRAYLALAAIDWPDGFYRWDIGWRALERDTKPPGQAE